MAVIESDCSTNRTHDGSMQSNIAMLSFITEHSAEQACPFAILEVHESSEIVVVRVDRKPCQRVQTTSNWSMQALHLTRTQMCLNRSIGDEASGCHLLVLP